MNPLWDIVSGDALEVLRHRSPGTFRTCVTSPPYWGLRDYGVPGQVGLEASPETYIEKMVAIFREVRRVLTADGTLWLNLGDTYATGAGMVGACPGGGEQGKKWRGHRGSRPQSSKHAKGAVGPMTQPNRLPIPGLKPKDLCGIPWRVALALQADGWYLRSDIIWAKPNPMPSSVRDRPTCAHEYLFLLAVSERYHYDAAAIAEPCADSQQGRVRNDAFGGKSWGERGQHSAGGIYEKKPSGWATGDRRHDEKVGRYKRAGRNNALDRPRTPNPRKKRDALGKQTYTGFNDRYEPRDTRNRRSVWTIPTEPFPGAHFATYPTALVEPCILAGSEPGDLVLDPFAGAGTTGLVATRLRRGFLGIELNPEYAALARRRIFEDAPLLHAAQGARA